MIENVAVEKAFGREFVVEKELKVSTRGRVCLVREGTVRYIFRTFEGNGDVYRRMLGLECPYLPKIYEVQEKNGQISVLEEYIPGDSLAFLLECSPLDQASAKKIFLQICQGVAALHGIGAVHRDIKPENVMLRGDDVVLIDFDASRLEKENAGMDTRIMGTTGYAAPEQYGFSQSDARADIYAMGILLNEMLTRKHPSQKLAEGVLRPVIERCIEVNVDKRYPNVRELQAAVRNCGKKRMRKWLGLAAAVVAAAMVATAGIGMMSRDEENQAIEPEAVSVSEEPWQGSKAVYMEPFRYDLDSDGEMEDYYFGIFHESIPEVKHFITEDSFGVGDGDYYERRVYPCVWKVTEDKCELVSEFAELLTDAGVTIWRAADNDSPAPEITTTEGLWSGGIRAVYGPECIGSWYYELYATLDGQKLTALAKTIVSEWEREAEPESVEISEEPWHGEEMVYMMPFQYDLDADGNMEDYLFGGFQENIPEGFQHTLSDTCGLSEGGECYRTVYPCVWKQEGDGKYQMMKEFAELLTDSSVTLWRAADNGAPAPKVCAASGMWDGGVQVTYVHDSIGTWYYDIHAVLDGQELNALTKTNIIAAEDMG